MADPALPAASSDQLSVPRRLESPRAKLLSLTFSVTQGAGASALRSVLGMSSLSLYPVLRDLRRAGLIERTDDGSLRVVEDAPSTAGGA